MAPTSSLISKLEWDLKMVPTSTCEVPTGFCLSSSCYKISKYVSLTYDQCFKTVSLAHQGTRSRGREGFMYSHHFFRLQSLRLMQSFQQCYVGKEHLEVHNLESLWGGPMEEYSILAENKWRLLTMMTLLFGSGIAAPFFTVRHQLLKR